MSPRSVTNTVVVVLLVIVAIVVMTMQVHIEREQRRECDRLGGLYIHGGRGGDDVCFVDGKVARVW